MGDVILLGLYLLGVFISVCFLSSKEGKQVLAMYPIGHKRAVIALVAVAVWPLSLGYFFYEHLRGKN